MFSLESDKENDNVEKSEVVEETKPVERKPTKDEDLEPGARRITEPEAAEFDTSKKVNYDLFEKILKTMNLEINEWGGNFYFVYLPAWTRYNNQYSLANITLKNKIKKIVVKNNIQFIDIDSVFKDFKVNNVDIYNLSIYGHYTKYGYNLIADKLIKTLSN